MIEDGKPSGEEFIVPTHESAEIEPDSTAKKSEELNRALTEASREVHERTLDFAQRADQVLGVALNDVEGVNRIHQALTTMASAISEWNPGEIRDEVLVGAFYSQGEESVAVSSSEDLTVAQGELRAMVEEKIQKVNVAKAAKEESEQTEESYDRTDSDDTNKAAEAWAREQDRAQRLAELDVHAPELTGAQSRLDELWFEIGNIIRGSGNPNALEDYVYDAFTQTGYLKGELEYYDSRLRQVRETLEL